MTDLAQTQFSSSGRDRTMGAEAVSPSWCSVLPLPLS